MKAMDILRFDYDLLRWTKAMAKEHGLTDRQIEKPVCHLRNRIRAVNAQRVDRLAQSLSKEWRYRYDEDGDGCTEYRIFPDCGETREEMEEWLEYEFAYPEIHSPYDCTGKRFTRWITAHRTKAGWAVVHEWGLDV